jgi:MFS superfamily sulfate permease-like transporter
MRRWQRWLPGLQILSEYKAAWLPHDVMAGLVLTTMLVPVGIAYALASGVPGIYGLYATIVPLLAYALFGPSRILVLGPDSSLAPVILAVVLPLSGGDAMRAVTIASLMAVVSGLVCMLIGVLRLGFITELLSKPIRYGYMNGIALTVLISQLPKLLGFSINDAGPLRDLVRITEGILGGKVNWTSFAVRGDSFAQALQAHSWPSACSHRRDCCGWYTEPPRYRRRKSSWSAAARTSITCLADDQFCLPRQSHYRRMCSRHRRVRGHERAIADVRREDTHTR